MKTPIICTLCLVIAGGMAAHAEGAKDGKKRQIPPGILKKYDTDGDGKLNEEERKAARAEFGRTKKQGDKQGEREIPKAILEKYDTDGNGELSEEERKALREDMEARRAERRAEFIAKYDKNGDGELNEGERQAARAGMEGKRKALIAKYDTDGDGKLSEEERKAAREDGAKLPGHKPNAKGQKKKRENAPE